MSAPSRPQGLQPAASAAAQRTAPPADIFGRRGFQIF